MHLTVCTYCGCACRLKFLVEGEKILRVLPDQTDEVSEGRPCIKGLTLHEVIQKNRVLKPMIREKKSAALKEVSWQEAYDFIYRKIRGIPPEDVLFTPSGKTTNEDCYAMQKFARSVFRTNNVDGCCTRLCHMATVKGLVNAFGNGAIPTKMNDIYGVDCLLIIGSNPASNYPVIFNRILKAKEKGMKIISVLVTSNQTSMQSDLALLIQPGTEAALLNCIMGALIKSGSYDKKTEKLEGFAELKRVIEKYSGSYKLLGIPKKQFLDAAEMIIESKSFGVMHGMGLTQHSNAMENIHSLLNLLILKNGKMLSSRGEINVQGVGDMGCLPSGSGKNMIQALITSPVKAAFISGFNPAQSMPDLDKVHRNLKKIFVVQMDHYLNMTSEFADVILPTPTLVEREGTITNGERRVRPVRKVIEPMGESKPEWLIFKELSKKFGGTIDYKDSKEIFEEIVTKIPAYSKIDANSVYNGHDAFADKQIKFMKFNPGHFRRKEKIVSRKYPLILTTFRSQFHFLTDDMTEKSITLNKSPDGPFCYMSAGDAKRLGIKDGDNVRVSSSVSRVETKAKIDSRVPEGVIGMHFHFRELPVNKLFPVACDSVCFTPNYKEVAVRVEKAK